MRPAVSADGGGWVMYCLHCGDCCRRFSPLSDGPCPHIVERDGFTLCGVYDSRPQQCRDHTFMARFCPIGMSIVKPTSSDEVRRRIDTGWEMAR